MFYIVAGTGIYLICTLSCTDLFYRDMICFIETHQHACTQNTHAPTVSYITLGKNHEAEACWLNYLMRCNKSWQDQLALESGFSSFYHYIEMRTIVERNVTLLFLSVGTQLCSTALKSSTSMGCKAWWMLWKMLPIQSLFSWCFFPNSENVVISCGQHWDPCSTHLAEQGSNTGEWSPECIPSLWPCLPPNFSFAAQHTMASFPLSHSTFSPGTLLADYCYHQLQFLEYLFLKIGVIKNLGHLSIWHGSKAPNVASHKGFLFNRPDLFFWKEICLNNTLFWGGRFCSCQWHPSISFMFSASPLNANQPLRNNCSQTNWMPLDSLEKECLSFEVYPIMMAAISRGNNCTSCFVITAFDVCWALVPGGRRLIL